AVITAVRVSALLLLALPYGGAPRLGHLQYPGGDPLLRRLTGLARVPTARPGGAAPGGPAPPPCPWHPRAAPPPPVAGPFGALIRTIGRPAVTTRCSPTWRRPATSCGSRTARATCTTPRSPPRSSAS